MTRKGNYSQGKRQREAQQAQKKLEKAERRQQKREQGAGKPEMGTVSDIVGNLPSIAEAMAHIEQRATASRAAASIPCRLFVGGISDMTGEQELRAAFAEFGPVVEAVILKDRGTGQSRGFGFVTMADRKDARDAINGLDGRDLNGRRLAVHIATDRPR